MVPDSVAVVRDSVAVVRDSVAVGRDSVAVARDSVAVAQDHTVEDTVHGGAHHYGTVHPPSHNGKSINDNLSVKLYNNA